jgi:histidine triad (HIT) family protein
MDPNCIFCKIAAGQIPCHKLYEDEHVLAFLDLGPLAAGHALLIPKHHARELGDLPDDEAAAVGRVLPRLARAITQATGTEAYNVLVNIGERAGQVVMHVHVHLIPKPAGAPGIGGQPGSGLGLDWPAGKLDADAGKALAQKIADALGG